MCVLDKPCLSLRAQIEALKDVHFEVHEVEMVETGVQNCMGDKITVTRRRLQQSRLH